MPTPAEPCSGGALPAGWVRGSSSLSSPQGSLISPPEGGTSWCPEGPAAPCLVLTEHSLARGFLGLVQGEKRLRRPLTTTGFTSWHFRRVSCYQETWNPEQTPHARPRSMPGREDSFPWRWARPAHSHSPGVRGNKRDGPRRAGMAVSETTRPGPAKMRLREKSKLSDLSLGWWEENQIQAAFKTAL